MAWDLGHLKIPRKTSGEVMESSYLNFVMQTLEKFINSLVDAYTQFELIAIQKVNGIRIEEEETEKYIVDLLPDHFSITEDEEYITLINGENDALWTNEAFGIKNFVDALNKMKEDYDAQIEGITNNQAVTDELVSNVLDKLTADLAGAIEELFVNLVLTTDFTYDLDLVVTP